MARTGLDPDPERLPSVTLPIRRSRGRRDVACRHRRSSLVGVMPSSIAEIHPVHSAVFRSLDAKEKRAAFHLPRGAAWLNVTIS